MGHSGQRWEVGKKVVSARMSRMRAVGPTRSAARCHGAQSPGPLVPAKASVDVSPLLNVLLGFVTGRDREGPLSTFR